MTEDTQSDYVLWAAAEGGDQEALGLIFDRHRGRVYRRALWLLGNVQDAQDVTASVFFEVWRKRAKVRLVDGSVLPWLLVVTSNMCRNQKRAMRRYSAILERLPRADDAGSAEGQLLASQDVLDTVDPQVASALRRLPWQTYALLIMTAVEGYPISDAAQAVGVSPGAAKTRLSRARSEIRSSLIDASINSVQQEGAK